MFNIWNFSTDSAEDTEDGKRLHLVCRIFYSSLSWKFFFSFYLAELDVTSSTSQLMAGMKGMGNDAGIYCST